MDEHLNNLDVSKLMDSSPEEIGGLLLDALTELFGVEKAEEIGKEIADIARENPDERILDIITDKVDISIVEGQIYIGGTQGIEVSERTGNEVYSDNKERAIFASSYLERMVSSEEPDRDKADLNARQYAVERVIEYRESVNDADKRERKADNRDVAMGPDEYFDHLDKDATGHDADTGLSDPASKEGVSSEVSGQVDIDVLKERYLDAREKYSPRNTFVIGARLELNLEAYRTGSPGANGKPVSGGEIAMDIVHFLQSNIFDSIIEIGIRDYFDKKYPAEKEIIDVTSDEEKVQDIIGEKPDDGIETNAAGTLRDDGAVTSREDKDSWKNDTRIESAGYYMGVDMKRDPDERESDRSMTVWRSGRGSNETVVVDGKIETLRVPDIRMVELNKTHYLVDPFGKVITHDGDRTSGKEFPDHFPRLDISASRRGSGMVDAAASAKGVSVERYKNMTTQDIKESFIERSIGRIEAHGEYVSKSALPELREAAADYREKVNILNTRIDEVKGIRAELENKPAEERGRNDHMSIENCDEKLARMESTRDKLSAAADRADVRIEKMEKTVTNIENASKVVKSDKTDVDAKFGVMVVADKDSVGKVADPDYGMNEKRDMPDIMDTLEDLDKDPRDVDAPPESNDVTDDSERVESPTYDVSDDGPDNLEQLDADGSDGITADGDKSQLDADTEKTSDFLSADEDQDTKKREPKVEEDGTTQDPLSSDAKDDDLAEEGEDVSGDQSDDPTADSSDADVEDSSLDNRQADQNDKDLLDKIESDIVSGVQSERFDLSRDGEELAFRPQKFEQSDAEDTERTHVTIDSYGEEVNEFDGPPTEADWTNFESINVNGIGTVYFTDVEEDGTLRFDVQTPPGEDFWAQVDAVNPEPEIIPYSSTEVADKLHDSIQRFYSNFDRDFTSNQPEYVDRMPEFQDHIKDVSCNHLPDGFQMPERECASVDEWKELQVERYAAAADSIAHGIPYERDNIEGYLDAHSYHAFEYESNLQFVYDNVGEVEYDKVMREYRELSGRDEYLDGLQGVCKEIADIAASDGAVDDKLSSIEGLFSHWFSPEIIEDSKMEAFKEGEQNDVAKEQRPELDDTPPLAGSQSLDIAAEDMTTGQDGPVEAQTSLGVDTSSVEAKQPVADAETVTDALDDQQKVADNGLVPPEELAEQPHDLLQSEMFDVEAPDEHDSTAFERAVTKVDDEDRLIAAADAEDDADVVEASKERLNDLASEKENFYKAEPMETTGSEQDKKSSDREKSKGDEEPTFIDDEYAISKEDILDAMDRYLEQGSDGTFSFKEDFLDQHEGQINPVDLYEALAEKAGEHSSDSEMPSDDLIDRVSSLLESIEDSFSASLEQHLEQIETLVDAFLEDGIGGLFDAVIEQQLDILTERLEGLANISDFISEHIDQDWLFDSESIKQSICDKLDSADPDADAIDKLFDTVRALGDVYEGLESALSEIGNAFSDSDAIDISAGDAAEAAVSQMDDSSLVESMVSDATSQFNDTPNLDVDAPVLPDADLLMPDAPDETGFAQDIDMSGSGMGDDSFRDFLDSVHDSAVDAQGADAAVSGAELEDALFMM